MAAKRSPSVRKSERPKSEVRKAFQTQAAWRAWLEQHHAEPDGIWIQFAKKGSDLRSCTYQEALEVALCFGWIDGQLRSLDASSFVRKFTPRRKGSIWSKINRDKAEALIAAGLMHAAGMAAIARAKEGGEWGRAYDSASKMSVPADFQAALDKEKQAAAFFAKLDKANRYGILWRVQTARNAGTRAKRISDLVAMLKRKETLHPWTFK